MASKKNSINAIKEKLLTMSLVAAFLATNLAWGVSNLDLSTTTQQPEVFIQQPEVEPLPETEEELPENCEELYEQVCVENRGKGIVQQTNCQHIQTMCEHILQVQTGQ